MYRRTYPHSIQSLAIALFCLGLFRSGLTKLDAATFNIADVQVELQEVTSDVAVYFKSMRLNRAINQWNVDVSLSNKTSRVIQGPLVLAIDSFRGTTGPLQTDGSFQEGAASKAFYDWSPWAQGGNLSPSELSLTRTLNLGVGTGSPVVVTRVFAGIIPAASPLAVVRSQNEVGQPLGSTRITFIPPNGLPAVSQFTDTGNGVASFASSAGAHWLQFSRSNHLSVWRQAVLTADAVTVVPNPRLTPLSTHWIEITPLGGTILSNEANTIHVNVGAGQFVASTQARITTLTGQTLPAFLPQGWSPILAFHFEAGSPPTQPLRARLQSAFNLKPSDAFTWIRWNESTLAWDTVQIPVPASDASTTVEFSTFGTYAWVVADTGILSPPPANPGQRLSASTVSIPASQELTATGVVTPSSAPASTVPSQVTAEAVVTINHHSAPIPSGTLLRGHVTEAYKLKDGTTRTTPSYEQYFVAYQRPGDDFTDTLQATFPMRPIFLFGAESLDSATVKIDVLPLTAFDGQVLDNKGGLLAYGNVQLFISGGTLQEATPFRVNEINVKTLTNVFTAPYSPVAAFELTFDSSKLSEAMVPRFTGLTTNSWYVLARVQSDLGYYGFEPVERLQTDGLARTISLEPTTGGRLPGITRSGQYILIRVPDPQALISGVARNGAGTVLPGVPVLIAGSPWLSLTDTQGIYRLIGGVGSSQVSLFNPGTGDTTVTTVSVANTEQTVRQDLNSTPTGPRVASISPAAEAKKVALISPVIVNFTKAVNPGTLLNAGIQLVNPSNEVVTASLSLDVRQIQAVLTPATPLNPGTLYRLLLSTNIVDLSGRALEGSAEFRFTTVPNSRVGESIAEMIIYEPGATNVPSSVLSQIPAYTPGSIPNAIVVSGSAGIADPEIPVILVNESTGETATVLSKLDGSFASVIEGTSEDTVSATFVNLNGTQVYVPTARQNFDNGEVGLFTQGGVLQVASPLGPIQVTVPPNAISSKTRFKLEPLSLSALTNQLQGVTPAEAVMAGSAVNIRVQGQLPSLPLKVRIPVNMATLNYPADEAYTNAAVALAAVKEINGITAFQEMDQMFFSPDASVVPPPPGRPRLAGNNEQLAAGFLDTSIGLVMPALGFAGTIAQIGFNQVLVPLLFGPRPVVIKGKVAGLPSDIAIAMEKAGLINQLANTQTGNKSIDVPWHLLQMMGFPNPITRFGGGIIQQFTTVSVFTFQQQAIFASKPLRGAFVSVALSGGVLNTKLYGRLFPGMVYATTGSDGYFLAVAPAAGAQYLIRATHPSFEEIQEEPANPITWVPGQQGDLTLSGVVWKNFFFTLPKPSETPPDFSAANTPIYPAPGQTAEIVIQASLQDRAPQIGVLLQSVGPTNLLTGAIEPNIHYGLSNIVEKSQGFVTRWTASLFVDKPVLASLKITIQGATGEQGLSFPYGIAFTGRAPADNNTQIPKPDTNDVHGPLVAYIDPPENAYLREDGKITVLFNKPIDAAVKQDLGGIILQGAPSGAIPVVELSRDQHVLTLRYPSLPADQSYELTLSARSIRDLAGQPMDQIPSTADTESFTTTLRTPPSASAPLLNLENAKGSVIVGRYLYVIDQGASANTLQIFNIENPLHPFLAHQVRLPGDPRDIELVPQFSYKRTAQSPVVTSDLIAIVGGDLDAMINQFLGTTVSTKGQYLWVLDVADPLAPIVLASPLVSLRIASAATKVRWSPPYLVYQEFGADIHHLGFVNLQEMIYGFGVSRTKQEVLPPNGRPGKDLNGDGDYVDPGELLPLPENFPAEFYGKKQSLVLQGTTQKILDFSISDSGNTVGITLRNGFALDANGKPQGAALPPMYRTWVQNGISLEAGDPTIAMYPFPKTAYPRWVKVFDALPLIISNAPTTRAVALVTLAPNTNGANSLVVIDISLPLSPKLLNEIQFPEEILGGIMGPVSQRPDGLLQVAGANNLVLINPQQLANTDVGPGRLHPAIMGSTLDAGGLTRSLGQNDYGINAVADGRRGTVVLSPPELRFISFSKGSELIDPTTLRNLPEESIAAILDKQTPLQNLAPAQPTNVVSHTSDLNPPNLALHYHVIFQAPGFAGDSIRIGLESLNPAGRPFSNLGVGFAPVRAISDFTQASTGQTPRDGCGAPISPLIAHRISSNPNNKYYNYYLSKPFVVITTSATLSELTDWSTIAGQHREILFSGANLRAFIDPVEIDNAVLGPFAARIDGRSQQVYPIAIGSAETVHRDYLVGDNPPPPGSATPVEDTFGTILSHSGELRTTDVDMSLPSPRMSISILRAIGTQDNYEGPFGVGWDFNYNERLTILDSKTFPAGLQIPMVVRENEADSDIAGSQDILFNNGLGRVYTFRWKGTNMPPEYAADPLIRDYEYSRLVSDYYLPLRGLFDLMVKFKDGRFERLTPDGTRYRYTSQGRLQTIIDRYPQNRHELQYDRNGWLVRIDDRSVTAPRYVEFGHYRRRNTDKEFAQGLDEDTANPFLEGKICKIRDYAGRDVLFQYDNQGFLTTSLGIEVSGENGGFSGRSRVTYSYDQCKLVGISAQKSGAPVVAASIKKGTRGKPVTSATTSSLASSKVNIPPGNSAANVASIQSGASLADGAAVTRSFDRFGHTTSETRSGRGTPAATLVVSNTSDGLRYYTKEPEGNVELRTYDSSNPNFRSRANLLSTTLLPGPRGGPTRTERFQYDPRYNLPSGEQTDANGFKITHTLTGDGRDVSIISYPNVGDKTASYDNNGQVLENTDQDGISVQYKYDGATAFLDTETKGNIILQYGYGGVAGKLGRASSVAQPLGAPTLFVYDNNLQLVRVSRGGLVTRTAYDELGRDTFHEEEVGDGKALKVTKVYNDAGFLTKITTDGLEVDGTIRSFTTEFKPDERSRIKESTLPSGTRQTYEYDARGNTLLMTLGSYSERYEYDLNNNVIKMSQGDDEVRRYSYDGHDRATNTVTLTGLETYTESLSYYPDGQLQSRTLSDSRFGIVNEMHYDQLDSIGRHKAISQIGGVISPTFNYQYGSLFNAVTGPRQTITTRWDAAGNQTALIDAIQEVTTERDGNGRTRSITHKEEGATYVQTFGYDDLDHQTTLDDLLGRFLTYVPRADGAQTKITNARNNTTSFDHSAGAEVLSAKRADGMEIRSKLDEQRQTLFNGDNQSGFGFGYDSDLRLSQRTLRNGAIMSFKDFDARNMPRSFTYPGGSATLFYDLQRRLIGRTMTYQATTWFESTTYDALGRIRNQIYSQNGGAQSSMTHTYDAAGPQLTSEYTEDNATFKMSMGYYPDGSRKTIQYPSGLILTETRDVTGRLTGISDSDGNILNALSWMGNTAPKEVDVGATLQTVHTYDQRGRLTGSRTVRKSDGKVVAHLRYQYDAANNLEMRQDWHRNGLSDSYQFDAGERLTQAQVGIIPQNGTGSTPPLYARSYSYSSGGLDFLTDSTLINILPRPPPFAQSWSGHDAFLLPTTVDGFDRGAADPKGNIAKANLWVRQANAEVPQSSPATLQHDALGRLVSVMREDGTEIVNQFQPSGLRFSRKVTQGGFLLSHSHFVYDSAGRLLEEYDRSSGQPVLIGRYIYASSDAPVAADLLNTASGTLERYYYLRDVAQSVVVIANRNGEAVERAQYDPFGQPTIQGRDVSSPEVLEVRSSPNGKALWIVLSESVWPITADPGVGGGIVRFTSTLDSSVLTVATGSTNIGGTLSLLPSAPGLPPYSVLEFAASRELPEVPSALNGWWPGDQQVTDVEAGHNGSLVGGATTGPGLIQDAFVLNGTTAYVQIPTDDSLNPATNNFTVALWVKLRSTAGQQVLIEKWQASPAAAGWSFLKTTDNRLRLSLGGAASVNIDSSPLTWSTNSWIQYAFRRQGNQFTLLTNGVQVATGTSTSNLDSSSAIRFGSRDGSSAFLNGSIDEVTLFERAMSDAEITALAGGLVSPGNLTVTLHPGKLADEWGNPNATSTVSVAPNDEPDVVYYRAVNASPTAPPSLARSGLQSPFLFQGQYFDYDTGLVYMRSRHYDPYSGMFMEPDPLGYESSVNHYAGLANNPVSARDPMGLTPAGITTKARNNFFRSRGYSGEEIHLINRTHHELSRLGMGDLEIAAHVRVMYKAFTEHGVSWEMSIRTFGNPTKRLEQLDRFHQTKEEKVSSKTQADGLARYKNKETGQTELFTGDLDGLYLLRNGQVATLSETKRFQDAINAEVANLSAGWRDMATKGGQEIVGTEVQRAYQHGVSLNIPQEYGSRNVLMKGGRCGIAGFDWIESKMLKGTGTAFSFKINEKGDGMDIVKSVDVNKMIGMYEDHYNNVMLNPSSSGFNRSMFNRRYKQFQMDWRAPATLYPKTFKGHNYGSPGAN